VRVKRRPRKIRLAKTQTKRIALLLGILMLAAGALSLLHAWEQSHFALDPSTSTRLHTLPARERVEYKGEWYVAKKGVESVLLIGIDKYDAAPQPDRYVNDRQADFLLLLVIDHDTKSFHALHLDRDTMTEIQALGLGGKPAGTFVGQLALSHTYGSGGKDSGQLVVRAVSHLLFNVEIDHYISVTMDAVPEINDLVGGVPVKVLDDFTGIDPTLIQGSDVTLRGEQALTYVRTRRGLEDSSNINRMARQRQYLTAFQEQWIDRSEEDEELVFRLVAKLAEKMTSDCSVEQLGDILAATAEYTFADYVIPQGVSTKGPEFMEFHVDGEALQRSVMNLFYIKE